MFTPQEKQYIQDLAYQSISHYFANGSPLEAPESNPSENLYKPGACFVTLTINGELRGCIGHTIPTQPLYLDIVENAFASAFSDIRFPPLSFEEFKQTEIEVSVLTEPKLLSFSSSEDFLNQLRPNIDGVIIQKGDNGATYLPQVWEDLPDKEEFLSSLCEKAGLLSDEWKSEGMKVLVYQVEKV
ncbi:MAG: hypothetical protein US58_C0024G0010 [Candidatus Magasanikbacteria bacterium GW2011_GWA2_37_8]|uniref:AMMECR1 domain-containing protein n=1 Tax=Candidatus Magasanikbacteria bacterium GW2011_GWA2_37_8 TaxID=1619036 RepID=A0A0G0JSW0_9BACT|nr:MAG: hypothetical protein US58_C0024G0010 [Candidatus Magasanikbacteria bacterium GW2011_GWA2_37_8]